MMKFYSYLFVIFCIGLIFYVLPTNADDKDEGDDDDDGVVEVEEEEVQYEKPKFKEPSLKGNAYFAEPFSKKTDFKKRWIVSEARKDGAEEALSKYDGKWKVEEPKESAVEGDLGLIMSTKAKHHAISAQLDKPFEFTDKPFIVQYDVRFQNGIDCGGAYVKLLSHSPKLDLKNFHDKTPYTVMFGPDKCGMDHKLHFIFRHKNPKTGEFEEKHAKKPIGSLDSYFSDKKTHLYTLIINPDNSFEVLVDNSVVNEGSLLEDVSPPVNPPKEIDDPNDKRPSDWDDREKIQDPDAKKPDDWDESEPEKIKDPSATKPDGWLDDEPELSPDPDAEKPSDWDDDMDGEWEAPLVNNPKCKDAPGCGKWEAPMINNPKYKGKWKASMIDNPNYKGIWKPRKIPNPEYFEDEQPYKMTAINALGLELWSMNEDIVFDNFIVTDDRVVAESWATETWTVKVDSEKAKAKASSRSVVDAVLDVTKGRPWLWAVFLVVGVLPVVLIIAYCCMSSSKKGILHTLKKAADDYPLLWAVYVVIILLPVLLLAICLCPRSGPTRQEFLDAQAKKTDQSSPDDENKDEQKNTEEGDENNQTENNVGAGGDNKPGSKKSKAALEVEENEEEEEQDEVEETESSAAAESKDSPRQSPRKRKTRKE